jgi:cephalosporin-C deacetylase-like acetyl esterase
VYGYGEGGLVAFYAAAIDERIQTAVVSGYFQPREDLWREPIYRNVWSLLKDFGDAEIAKLIAPRKLIVETRPGPTVTGPPKPDGQRRGAAPGVLAPVPLESIRKEAERARHMGANIEVAQDGITSLLTATRIRAGRSSPPNLTVKLDRGARQRRQIDELVEYSQRMVRDSERIRYEKLAKLDLKTPQGWTQSGKPLRDQVWNEMIGRLPAPTLPPNIRTRKSLSGVRWDGFEVVYDVFPDVYGYGVLLLPKDLKPGERRPVVVVQHGLEGRAQDMFGQPEVEQTGGKATTFFYYRNIGSRLADQGFIVYSPQNPYIGENLFRQMQRQAHPLKLSLFSLILAQNERLLDWLTSLPYVDPARIGFYGLSYGGKTALRIPPLLDRYALSICSGDFNEWIVKLTTVDAKNTYIFTQEYEMWEWDQAHIANHAELAMLMAPRPFMVERGHRDGVGEDEWVSYEYAKVRRFYDEMGIGDRTTIEYFNGPHRINGVGTVEFLKKLLMRPANLLGVAERD